MTAADCIWKIEIELSIQRALASESRLMGIIRSHLRLDLRGDADFTIGNSHWKNLFLNSNEFPRYYYYQPLGDIEYGVYLLLNAYQGAQATLEHGAGQNPAFADCPAYPKKSAIAK